MEWLPRESAVLATDLLRAPNDWRQHFQLAVHSGNCGVAYGDRSLRRAPMRRWAKQAHWYLCSIVKVAKPGLYLVEMMPWLNVLPRALAPWKREADRIYNVGSGVLHEMYEEGLASPVRPPAEKPSLLSSPLWRTQPDSDGWATEIQVSVPSPTHGGYRGRKLHAHAGKGVVVRPGHVRSHSLP